MDKSLREDLQTATQNARQLLEHEFSEQLEGRFDIRPDGTIPDKAGPHLNAQERVFRQKLVATIRHKVAGGQSEEEAVQAFVREAAFTTLNRFAALKMLEVRGMVQQCVSGMEKSSGFKEFTMLAPGLSALPDGGYRLYIESVFDEIGQEVSVLFDRQEVAGMLWPRRQALHNLVDILNRQDLADAWQDAEAIGWVYQYFNSKDERQEMRSESSTPRNSHELAVRNQFFTPRYVVQFLTDNSLGRTWYEIQEGNTRLLEACDYLVQQPNEVFLSQSESPPETNEDEEDDTTYVPHRPKKDPRALRVLDPACGSGHFLLYAFDLLWTIYEEAWEDTNAPAFDETGRTLREDYDTQDELHRALPGLILKYNLYGVDIDPRATQIAAFALWMRAQEAFNDIGLARGNRPRITKTNVVVAEPMPGDKELRQEFAESLQPNALGQLVDVVFDQMELAGEAGTLLRIEEEIRDAIKEAKAQWEKPKQLELLPEKTRKEFRQAGLFDVSNISDEQFWSTVEGQIYRALAEYAERGEQKDGLRRQLFADDASSGFAFVDLSRQRYDVVLMNPPFGEPADSTKSYIADQYPNSKSDILQAFVERAEEYLQPAGYLGAITNRTSFFLSSAQSWRERVVLRRYRPLLLADFGHGVLDAMVETAAYVFRSLNETEQRARTQALLPDLKRVETNGKGKFSVPKYVDVRSDDLKRHQAERELELLLAAGLIADASGRHAQYTRRVDVIRQLEGEDLTTTVRPPLICFRLLEADDKGRALYEAVRKAGDARRFFADPKTFADVPGSPFAYWASDHARRLFSKLPPLENGSRKAEHGLSTKDDPRYLRCWWEVEIRAKCPPGAHPEEWSGRYCVPHYRWFHFAKGGEFSPFYSDLHLVVNWYQEGREIEADVLNKYTYLEGDANWVLHRECDYFRPGLTWSRRTTSAASFRPMPAGSLFSDKGPSVFLGNHWTGLAVLQSNTLAKLIELHLAAADAAARSYELGIIRDVPVPVLDEEAGEIVKGISQAKLVRASRKLTKSISIGVPAILEYNGTLSQRASQHSLSVEEERKEMEELKVESEEAVKDLYGLTDEGERLSLLTDSNSEDHERQIETPDDLDQHALELVSYALGASFGRWDVRYATGECDLPDLPDPFDPLPVCPPGMLTGGDDLPLIEVPDGYPLPDVPADGILVDDPGHDRDLLGRVRAVLALIFEDETAAEREACDLLGESDLRSYFRKTTGFFKAHRKQYSKSRRKAPIYWQLAPSSTDYSVWLYYPKLTQDTFYRVLEVVKDKIRHEERRLTDLQREAGTSPNSTQRKDIADKEDFVSELRGFRKEIERVAPLWNPNMNDGVVINYAPLWRLVQHNRSWQKECKKHWDRLTDGEYDWSHWAMHLWPERVIPKCAERRDLAIAHDLEEVFWRRNTEGDWVARDQPTQPVKEIIEERRSPTVKAALKELMMAPAPR